MYIIHLIDSFIVFELLILSYSLATYLLVFHKSLLCLGNLEARKAIAKCMTVPEAPLTEKVNVCSPYILREAP